MVGPVGHRPFIPPTPLRVEPVCACPDQALHQHRMQARPVLNDLLEHLPGDVPFSTHLEIENARSRLVNRAENEAPTEARPERPGSWRTYTRPAPADVAPTSEPAPRGPTVPYKLANAQTHYAQRRTRWPLGGMIDLVV